MTDYIKYMYSTIKVRCSYTKLNKKELLRRYLRRYKGIDISRECIDSRIK
jgi:hypothetical protein